MPGATGWLAFPPDEEKKDESHQDGKNDEHNNPRAQAAGRGVGGDGIAPEAGEVGRAGAELRGSLLRVVFDKVELSDLASKQLQVRGGGGGGAGSDDGELQGGVIDDGGGGCKVGVCRDGDGDGTDRSVPRTGAIADDVERVVGLYADAGLAISGEFHCPIANAVDDFVLRLRSRRRVQLVHPLIVAAIIGGRRRSAETG